MDGIYQKMWTDSFPKLKTGNIQMDEQIGNTNDTRRGITLLIRPKGNTLTKIKAFLKKTAILAPNQYFYPLTDLHLTTLSIFSCRSNFQLNEIDLPVYKQLIKSTLQPYSPFEIHYSGITVAPLGVVLKGYDKSGQLNNIRAALRSAFKAANLENTMDHRYTLEAAHSTLIRFKSRHQSTHFGTIKVTAIELVYNDWYMSSNKVRQLDQYILKQG